jgi:GR25 family glycosyltransferase involved in LPS biosynthesis
MRIFVINLKRRPDRLAAITANLAKYGVQFERIEAIDAKTDPTMSKLRRWPLAWIYAPESMSNPFIANILSHRKIWQKMVAENISQALILEDDAEISNWDEQILNVDIAAHGLQFLRVGANAETTTIKPASKKRLPARILDRDLYQGKLWGTVAQIVTLEGARTCLRMKLYWFPCDHFEVYRYCYGIKYAIISPLLWQPTGSSSDIAAADHKPLAKSKRRRIGLWLRHHVAIPIVLTLERLRKSTFVNES